MIQHVLPLQEVGKKGTEKQRAENHVLHQTEEPCLRNLEPRMPYNFPNHVLRHHYSLLVKNKKKLEERSRQKIHIYSPNMLSEFLNLNSSNTPQGNNQ